MISAFTRSFRVIFFLSAACAATVGTAAIDPRHYIEVASDQFHLREIARVDVRNAPESPQVRRITIVAQVLAVVRSSSARTGDIIVIDYTIDLAARERAEKDHVREYGNRPGPQFLYEPDPPKLDASRKFWANLAPVATRLGNVNRHAGARVEFQPSAFTGAVFVPVSGQYSFDRPTHAKSGD